MYHKLIIAGNLGRDPEMRYLQDGTAVTNFTVAVNDGFGERKKTLWVRVSAFGRRAEVANQYLSKGSKILVEGTLTSDDNGEPRTWTSRDGTVRASWEMRADNFTFIGSRDDASNYSGPSDNNDYSGGGGGSSSSSQPAIEEDDIPF